MSNSMQVFALPRTWRRLFAVVGSAALLLPVAGCTGGNAETPPAGAPGGGRAAMAMPVEIVTLAEKPVEQVSEFVGTLKSRRSTTVQSQMEGFILKINVKAGDHVKPGTVMFEIDATSLQAAIASLESVRAARQADAAFAKQQADRARQLVKVGAMSQQELDQALAAQQAADAQLKATDEQIKQQRNEWGYSRVTAAAEGIVGDIPVRQGDRITRSTTLTTIEDNSGLELYVNVPVQEAPKLRMGLPIVLLDQAGQPLVTERVSFISPSVDDATQTVLVKTPVGARASFRADQFVRAQVIWSTVPALTVPIVAVSRISGAHFVFVAEPANGGLVARQRPVNVGNITRNDYVVLSGLKPGDKVIVAGVQKIGDGVPVAPMPPGGQRGQPPAGQEKSGGS